MNQDLLKSPTVELRPFTWRTRPDLGMRYDIYGVDGVLVYGNCDFRDARHLGLVEARNASVQLGVRVRLKIVYQP